MYVHVQCTLYLHVHVVMMPMLHWIFNYVHVYSKFPLYSTCMSKTFKLVVYGSHRILQDYNPLFFNDNSVHAVSVFNVVTALQG